MTILLTLGFLLYGGFYNWCITILGAVAAVILLVEYRRKKTLYAIQWKSATGLLAVLCVSPMIIGLWAIDYAENMAGILRGIVLFMTLLLVGLMTEEEKEKGLSCIPVLGAVTTVTGIVANCSVGLRNLFWTAGRLGGFFQYPNTCALFELIGIIICTSKLEKKKDSFWMGILLLLVTGLFLTGSRGILILSMLWGAWHAKKNKKFVFPFLILLSTFLLCGGVYAVCTGDRQNVGRIFTLLTSNSTIYGRMLYDIDALRMIARYPAGTGYMGYYYLQQLMQTGVYTTRFVHNDWLQLGIDYGIVDLLVWIAYVVLQFRGKNRTTEKTEILLVILCGMLMDFHMQYLIIDMILLLCVEIKISDKKKKKPEILENEIFLVGIIAVMTYFSVVYFAVYGGWNQTALMLFKNETTAQMKMMNEATNSEVADLYADAILAHNPYVADAWNVKAYVEAMGGNYKKAIENKEKYLKLNRYRMTAYDSYNALIAEMEEVCLENADGVQLEYLREKEGQAEQLLEKVKSETNRLAYRIKEQPQW